MNVGDGMSNVVVSVGPNHTLREAAALMVSHEVGAAIVLDPDGQGPGILTERDVLRAVAAGRDPATERVGSHLTGAVTTAMPHMSLEWAGETMLRGGFRHLVVTDETHGAIGMLSVRDVVRHLLAARPQPA